MNITPQMYSRMSENASPKSNYRVNIAAAFAVGGLICVIGQLLLDMFGKETHITQSTYRYLFYLKGQCSF